ncbi:hypothetical protein ZWY2020_047756 [Hordeum vulgare]|nr:hypothetical protein ZWY2020_047756 [Hordeum vulgare]
MPQIYHYTATVPQEFCLSTLQSDNRSIEAKDLHDLVFIAMDITKGRVTAANNKVKKMVQNTQKGTVTMHVLTFCEVYYEELAGMLNVCDAMIKDYPGYKGQMRSEELALCVSTGYYSIIYCGDELHHMPKAEALMKENDELKMLVKMSANFLVPLELRKEILFGH